MALSRMVSGLLLKWFVVLGVLYLAVAKLHLPPLPLLVGLVVTMMAAFLTLNFKVIGVRVSDEAAKAGGLTEYIEHHLTHGSVMLQGGNFHWDSCFVALGLGLIFVLWFGIGRARPPPASPARCRPSSRSWSSGSRPRWSRTSSTAIAASSLHWR